MDRRSAVLDPSSFRIKVSECSLYKQSYPQTEKGKDPAGVHAVSVNVVVFVNDVIVDVVVVV